MPLDDKTKRQPQSRFRRPNTAVKDEVDLDFDPLRPQQDHKVTRVEDRPEQEGQSRNNIGAQRTASRTATQQSMSKVTPREDMMNNLRALLSTGLEDDIVSDDELRAPRETPSNDLSTDVTNLPALVNKSIGLSGKVHPEWHKISNLPGYMLTAIRALGRQVFGIHTSTPIEDIHVIANFGGQGPNSEREVNAVAAHAKEFGDLVTKGSLDYKIFNVETNYAIYNVEDAQLMVVQDDYGIYVYMYPLADAKNKPTTGVPRLTESHDTDHRFNELIKLFDRTYQDKLTDTGKLGKADPLAERLKQAKIKFEDSIDQFLSSTDETARQRILTNMEKMHDLIARSTSENTRKRRINNESFVDFVKNRSII